MKHQAIIGIDPGQKGGICVRPIFGPKQIHLYPMPLLDEGIDWAGLAAILEGTPGKVFVEVAHAMPKQGVSSTFKFGLNYGGIFGVCGALGLPTELVRSQAWKKEILADYEDRNKEAAIDCFSKVWPQDMLIPKGCRKPQDGLADAWCISEYGWRSRG